MQKLMEEHIGALLRIKEVYGYQSRQGCQVVLGRVSYTFGPTCTKAINRTIGIEKTCNIR